MKVHAIAISLLICFSVYTNIKSEEKTVFISLGSWCVPALFLKTYNLREAPLPFDWITSGSVENLCSLLKSNFSNFLRKENTIINPSSPTFVYDKGSQCGFNHDFPIMGSGNYAIVPNYLDYYTTVKKRYENRIKTFNEIMHSNHHVIFLRLDLDGSKQKGQQLRNTIASLYSTLDFDILYIGFTEEFKKSWHLDRIANIFIAGRTIEHGIDYGSPSWQIVRSTIEYLSGMTMQQLARPLGHLEDEAF